jgi:RHS repeat-associated protein
VADAAGATVWRWNQAEPFGVNVPDQNPSGLGAFEFPLRFPGQYFDNDTGLTYNRYRNYSSELGRFAESDPIGLRGGLNTFGYVDGNPLDSVDPSGLIKCFYSPVNMNLEGCTLVSRDESDHDLYDWRKTGEVIYLTLTISKPQYGMGPSRPNPKLPVTQPPASPNVVVSQYWEVQFGYDINTQFRQNVLNVEEQWLCSGPDMCRANDPIKSRSITCFSDWIATDNTRRSPWMRGYLKNL